MHQQPTVWKIPDEKKTPNNNSTVDTVETLYTVFSNAVTMGGLWQLLSYSQWGAVGMFSPQYADILVHKVKEKSEDDNSNDVFDDDAVNLTKPKFH